MESSPQAASRRVNPFLIGLIALVALMGVLALASGNPDWFALAAGPWSAAICGHSCGLSSNAPIASTLLAVVGAVVVYANLVARRTRWWLVGLLVVFVVLWLMAAMVGIINMSM